MCLPVKAKSLKELIWSISVNVSNNKFALNCRTYAKFEILKSIHEERKAVPEKNRQLELRPAMVEAKVTKFGKHL